MILSHLGWEGGGSDRFVLQDSPKCKINVSNYFGEGGGLKEDGRKPHFFRNSALDGSAMEKEVFS